MLETGQASKHDEVMGVLGTLAADWMRSRGSHLSHLLHVEGGPVLADVFIYEAAEDAHLQPQLLAVHRGLRGGGGVDGDLGEEGRRPPTTALLGPLQP